MEGRRKIAFSENLVEVFVVSELITKTHYLWSGLLNYFQNKVGKREYGTSTSFCLTTFHVCFVNWVRLNWLYRDWVWEDDEHRASGTWFFDNVERVVNIEHQEIGILTVTTSRVRTEKVMSRVGTHFFLVLGKLSNGISIYELAFYNLEMNRDRNRPY